MNLGKIPLVRALRFLLFAADGHLLLFLVIRFAIQPLTGYGLALFLFLIPGTAWNLFLIERFLHGKEPDPEKRDCISPFLLYLLPALVADMIFFPLTLHLLPHHPVWFLVCNLPFPAAAGVLSLKKKSRVKNGILAPLLVIPLIFLLFFCVHFMTRHTGQVLVPIAG